MAIGRDRFIVARSARTAGIISKAVTVTSCLGDQLAFVGVTFGTAAGSTTVDTSLRLRTSSSAPRMTISRNRFSITIAAFAASVGSDAIT